MRLQLLLASGISLSLAKTVTYNFDIGWETRAPDGFSRPVMAINGQWPCPTIEADLGDTIVVKAKNSLGNQTTSLHFHGMYQEGSTAYDGGVGVSQCPIEGKDEFTYTFKADPPGTSWYHGHDKGQYPDGLRGVMVIHDREWEKKLGIDEQIYLSMSDWYQKEFTSIIADYLDPSNTDGEIPSPDSFLFNETRKAPEIRLKPGKRYLIRLVSMSSLACGDFHIDGHKLTVVGADGVQTHPYVADTIQVCAGQRYDILVVGHKNPKEDYQWITKMDTSQLRKNKIPSDDSRSVIGKVGYGKGGKHKRLRVRRGRKKLDSKWKPESKLNDMKLRPLNDAPLLKPVDKKISLATNMTYFEDIGSRIGTGSQPWSEPKVPTLYTALSMGKAAHDPATYGPGVDPHILKHNEIVQVYMENDHEYPHPMHIHGHSFQVLARGEGSWDGKESKLPEVPMMRDTVMIPKNGFVLVRFKADNPGIWFFHCHVDLHLVGGMASTFIESPDLIQKHQSIPDFGHDICTKSGRVSWGNCAGTDYALSSSDATDQCNTVWNSSYDSDSYDYNGLKKRNDLGKILRKK